MPSKAERKLFKALGYNTKAAEGDEVLRSATEELMEEKGQYY
jgi:hypothetical protein